MALEKPSKTFDFAHSRTAPGYELQRQFDDHRRVITALIAALNAILRADGKLNNEIVTSEAFPRAMIEGIVADAVGRARWEADIARRSAMQAQELLEKAEKARISAQSALMRAENAAARAEKALGELGTRSSTALAQAETLVAQAETLAARTSTPLPHSPVLGYGAGGFYAGDEEGATATAADYAQVSIEWAEHLPDTIPPNVLAINAITGEHWSSRWWAIKAQGAMGMQALWFQGSYGDPGPPTTPLTPTGDPIPPGAMYWNTDHNQMMVWDGTSWTALGVPAAATSSSLFYEAVDGQTAFATTDPDIAGRNFQLRADGSNGVNVFLNGIRLTLTRDYAVDAPSSTVTLAYPAVAGSILTLDVLVPQSDIAPGGVSIHKCSVVNGFDGTTTSFDLQTLDGATLVVGGSNELSVVLDGVPQEPGVDYAATGSTISFAVAPRADAKSFIMWFTPVTEPVVETVQ